ncbi:MAG: TetR family transcriptional regulator [Polyangiales bacterium]
MDLREDTGKSRSDETRARIVAAAIEAFSSRGFDGASTRHIAALAGENQGLITYYFGTKESLWKAAVDQIFQGLTDEIGTRSDVLADADPTTRIRLFIYYFVRHAARHPEQMRLMVQEGKADSARMEWLVDRHVKELYEFYVGLVCEAQRAGILPDVPVAHLYYILVGATSLIFTAAPECRRLTGTDPMDDAAIETHAKAVCRLILH